MRNWNLNPRARSASALRRAIIDTLAAEPERPFSDAEIAEAIFHTAARRYRDQIRRELSQLYAHCADVGALIGQPRLEHRWCAREAGPRHIARLRAMQEAS